MNNGTPAVVNNVIERLEYVSDEKILQTETHHEREEIIVPDIDSSEEPGLIEEVQEEEGCKGEHITCMKDTEEGGVHHDDKISKHTHIKQRCDTYRFVYACMRICLHMQTHIHINRLRKRMVSLNAIIIITSRGIHSRVLNPQARICITRTK